MLGWALFCLVLALIAAVLGFGGLAGAFVGFAKILFFVFIFLLLFSEWKIRTRILLAVPVTELGRNDTLGRRPDAPGEGGNVDAVSHPVLFLGQQERSLVTCD